MKAAYRFIAVRKCRAQIMSALAKTIAPKTAIERPVLSPGVVPLDSDQRGPILRIINVKPAQKVTRPQIYIEPANI